jgi:enoyl-CoA hydratase/carnithine racemase
VLIPQADPGQHKGNGNRSSHLRRQRSAEPHGQRESSGSHRAVAIPALDRPESWNQPDVHFSEALRSVLERALGDWSNGDLVRTGSDIAFCSGGYPLGIMSTKSRPIEEGEAIYRH